MAQARGGKPLSLEGVCEAPLRGFLHVGAGWSGCGERTLALPLVSIPTSGDASVPSPHPPLRFYDDEAAALDF